MLFLTTTFGLTNSFRHRRGDFIAVENCLTVNITRCTTNGLNQRTFGTQETFFVSVKDCHQRNFRHIQPFTQQVDTHQHVEFTQAQIADDLHTLDGINIGVQIPHPLTVFLKVIRQVFRHAFGQRGDEDAFIDHRTFTDF